jgi:protein phosphatase 1 regulatory subunit 11
MSATNGTFSLPMLRHRSQTITQVQEKLNEVIHLILKLRVQKHVSWDPDVIDNEHLGRKKSKCCCVYVPAQQAARDASGRVVPPKDRLDASDDESDIDINNYAVMK